MKSIISKAIDDDLGVDKEVVNASFEDRFLNELVSPCLYGCDLVLLIDIGN